MWREHACGISNEIAIIEIKNHGLNNPSGSWQVSLLATDFVISISTPWGLNKTICRTTISLYKIQTQTSWFQRIIRMTPSENIFGFYEGNRISRAVKIVRCTIDSMATMQKDPCEKQCGRFSQSIRIITFQKSRTTE